MLRKKSLAGAQVVAGLLVSVNFAVAMWAIDRLPKGAVIATHWGMDGKPDVFSGKYLGLLFMPVLGAFLWTSLCNAIKFETDEVGRVPVEVRIALTAVVLVIQLIAEAGLVCEALRLAAWPFAWG